MSGYELEIEIQYSVRSGLTTPEMGLWEKRVGDYIERWLTAEGSQSVFITCQPVRAREVTPPRVAIKERVGGREGYTREYRGRPEALARSDDQVIRAIGEAVREALGRVQSLVEAARDTRAEEDRIIA